MAGRYRVWIVRYESRPPDTLAGRAGGGDCRGTGRAGNDVGPAAPGAMSRRSTGRPSGAGARFGPWPCRLPSAIWASLSRAKS